MDSIINLQKKIVPELTDLLVQRYQILRQVSHESPIGRRALAGKLGLSERVLRAQVDFLKKSGLLAFSASGMSVTDEGAMQDLRKIRDEQSETEKITLRFYLFPIHIHKISHGLKGIKGNAQRKQKIKFRYLAFEYTIHIENSKIRILQDRKHTKV